MVYKIRTAYSFKIEYNLNFIMRTWRIREKDTRNFTQFEDNLNRLEGF